MKTELVIRAAGGRVPLAKHLGVTRQAVSQWGGVVPERHQDKCREILLEHAHHLRVELAKIQATLKD